MQSIDKAQAGVEKITQKVTGSGHCAPKKKMHMHGCGFAPGSVMQPGYGLNVSNLGFVQAPIPAGAYVNQVAGARAAPTGRSRHTQWGTQRQT
jgi:hypothetical protein